MLRRTLLLSLVAVLGCASAGAGQGKPSKAWVFVGTYSPADQEGIRVFEMDLATGALTAKGGAKGVANPSFLAVHPNGRFLYAVGEAALPGKKGGAVAAFALDPATGALTLLNLESSVGNGPCHIVVDKAGKNALVANYGGGSIAALPIGEDGRLKPHSAFVQHTGSSVNPGRQKEPHAHSINLDPANRFAFCADLGLDKVMVYRFDGAKGTLEANDPAFGTVAPGSGPRHFAFHPSGRYAYVINEMLSTLTAFTYDAAKGSLTELQTLPTLPHEVKGNSTAEVVVSPDGRFVYGSNRGHDTIATFEVDAATGKLTAKGHAPILGKTPRNFAIDPTGDWLLAAGQGSNSVQVFRRNASTGALEPTPHRVEVPKPVCVRYLARP
jgi:6-phosphogluconolactonase